MPLFLLLTQYHDASVVMCHSKTHEDDLRRAVKECEILVVACGVPQFVKADWLSEGQTVIDVGITYVEGEDPLNPEIFGDVEFSQDTIDKVRKITPVPGGVGPMTVTMLMNNLSAGWIRQNFSLQLN